MQAYAENIGVAQFNWDDQHANFVHLYCQGKIGILGRALRIAALSPNYFRTKAPQLP